MKFLVLALMLQLPLSREPSVSLYQLLSSGGKNKAVVFFEVPNSKLVFKKAGDLYRAEIELRVSLYDKEGELVYEDYWVYSSDVRSYSRSISNEEGISRSVLLRLPGLERGKFQIRLVDRNAHEILGLDTLVTFYGEGMSDLIPLSLSRYSEGERSIIPAERGVSGETLLVFFQADSIVVGSECRWTLERLHKRKKNEIMRSGEIVLSEGENTLFVPLTELENGMYLLRATADGYERILKFRKQSLWSMGDKEYKNLVSSLVYIADPGELKRLKEAGPDERKRMWDEFWEKRDPTPGTPYNELKEEYLERVAYANEHFSLGSWPGYKTDRGRIYILLGPPDEIEDHPFDVDAYPYQIWYYHTKRLALIFVDQSGAGDYVLVYPPYDFNFEF